MIQRDYLSFHEVFEQRSQYKSHQRRVAQIKGSSYNDQQYGKLMDIITGFQMRMRKRNHQIQEQEIQGRNEFLAKRIKEIKKIEPRNLETSLNNYSSRRYLQQEKDLRIKNNKLKMRLKSIESDIDHNSLKQQYQRHQQVLERMQRFKRKNDKCILKSLERIENIEVFSSLKQGKVHSTRTGPDKPRSCSQQQPYKNQCLFF